MRLRLTGRGTGITPELDGFARRRIYFALARFAGRIRSVAIRLADANGPRGGMDKHCDILITTGAGRALVVRERQAGFHAAVAMAAERAGRAVARQLDLERGTR